ncbi:MAG TPA: DNA-binding protein [Candidatus Nitrosotenuis sp.]|jgi:DNA-binding protein Alba|nr:DNA-binding protein [Candidatus Nitrosotenuis sp.]
MSQSNNSSEAQEILEESQKIKISEEDANTKKIRDVIFVGTKPIMTYVTSTLTQLSSQQVVTIKARGQRITQAVDVSQMIVKKMNAVGYIIKDVRISSDSLLSQDGKTRNVSTIEIDISIE